VAQPNLCVICNERKIDEKGCIDSPGWIIEILSPAISKKDLNEKYNLYEENGVKEYWVVFSDSNVINQYVLINGQYEFINTFGRYDALTPAIFLILKIELKEYLTNRFQINQKSLIQLIHHRIHQVQSILKFFFFHCSFRLALRSFLKNHIYILTYSLLTQIN